MSNHKNSEFMSKTKEFVSTGQAADLCSVTADTVLKWIKSGRIPANRTPGGHYRINRQTLLTIIESGTLVSPIETPQRSFQFCWEFYGNGCDKDKCQECIVYRSRAMRCYEMSELAEELGHSKTYCLNSCENCEYFRVVQGQRLNVLIITRDDELLEDIKMHSATSDFNLRVADNEYESSMIIENFRPDYVVIDYNIGKDTCTRFVKYLDKDPRIPFVKMIMAADADKIPPECDKTIFARINYPFSVYDLDELIGHARTGTEN